MYQFVPYLWLSLFLTVLIGFLFVYGWKNLTVLGARCFLLTLTLVEMWVAAQALEMAALDLPTKLVWANVQFMPVMLTTVAYLYLALKFTRRENILRRRWLLPVLLAAPLVFNILVWTNGYHELVRQNVSLNTSGLFPTIDKDYGPLFWVFAAYNYGLAICIFMNLFSALKEKAPIYKKQILFLILALLLPVAANLLQITGLNPCRVDITPAFFGLSALIISLGIFRYRLFDVVPIAHSIIIQEMRTGMIVLDKNGRIVDSNPAARRMLNLPSENLIGYSFKTVASGIPDLARMDEEGSDTVCEIAVRNKETTYYYEVSFTQIKNSDGDSIGRLLQIYDITERKTAEAVIQYTALHDCLTGLVNRNNFEAMFSQVLTLAKKHEESFAVAFLDLDNFKSINDTHGHDVGDKVLCEVAKRLEGVLRESDIISRVGGDEFAVTLLQVGSDEKMDIIGNKIAAVMAKQFEISGVALLVKASLGFSVYPRDGDSMEVLLKKADKAMYRAKGNGDISYCIYRE